VSGKQVVIDKIPCAELLYARAKAPNAIKVWVAPGRDYVITRMAFETNNRITYQLTVQYREDPQHGWVPSNWQIVNNNREGRLQTSTASTVTDYQINERIPTSTFDLVFPPGSAVDDQRAGKHFVIKPSGEKREILPIENGATYEQIMNSNTGEALANQMPKQRKTTWHWSGGLVLVSGVTALLAYLYRQVRRRTRPSTVAEGS
jgi:hypothetical protein